MQNEQISRIIEVIPWSFVSTVAQSAIDPTSDDLAGRGSCMDFGSLKAAPTRETCNEEGIWLQVQHT